MNLDTEDRVDERGRDNMTRCSMDVMKPSMDLKQRKDIWEGDEEQCTVSIRALSK